MESEFKRAMKLMWGNKRLQESFGCSFGMRGNGWILLIIIFADAAPLLMKVVGIELSETVQKWLLAVGFVGYILIVTIMMESIFVNYRKSGKALASFPMAKWVLTKGIMINLLVYYVCCFALIAGFHGICVVLKASSTQMTDDIIFFYGLFFFVEAVMQLIMGMFDKWNDNSGHYSGIMAGMFVVFSGTFGTQEISIGVSVLWHIAFLLCGGLLMYWHLVRKYKTRSGFRMLN